jgi:hypothetical protein
LVKRDLRADRIDADGWNQGKETRKPIAASCVFPARASGYQSIKAADGPPPREQKGRTMEIVGLAVFCVTILAGSPLLLAERRQRRFSRRIVQTSQTDETSP